jgi:Flp pilus assembly protein TadB
MSKEKELKAKTMWARPEEVEDAVFVELEDKTQERATRRMSKTGLIFLALIVFVSWATRETLLDCQLGAAMIIGYAVLFVYRIGYWWRGMNREED